MKVLTLDDNPITGVLLSDLLKELGYEVLVAKNAENALQLVEREQPRICILDWMMPDADGLELACFVRERSRDPGVYIIMLSSRQDLESIGLAYEAGVDDFVSKPVAPGELQARMRTAARLMILREQYAAKCHEVAALTARLGRAKLAA